MRKAQPKKRKFKWRSRYETWRVAIGKNKRLRGSKKETILGMCRPKSRQILVAPNLGRRLTLDTLIHEGLHAEFPDLDEDVVEQVGTNLADLVIRGMK